MARNKTRGTFVMRDLQAQHAIQREYSNWTHGDQFDQRQLRRMGSDAEAERALTGGFDASRSNMCPCNIARARNGAATCGAEH